MSRKTNPEKKLAIKEQAIRAADALKMKWPVSILFLNIDANEGDYGVESVRYSLEEAQQRGNDIALKMDRDDREVAEMQIESWAVDGLKSSWRYDFDLDVWREN